MKTCQPRFELRDDVIWELIRSDEDGASWRPYAKVDSYPALLSALKDALCVLTWDGSLPRPECVSEADVLEATIRKALTLAEGT